MRTVIEHICKAKDREEAAMMCKAERQQQGCIGARVIGDGHTKLFAVQSFYPDEPELTSEQISFVAGLNRRLCPESMLAIL